MNLKENILKNIDKKGSTFNDLLKVLSFKNKSVLDKTLRELATDNKIYFKFSDKKYYLKDENEYVGIFKETRHDYGFVEKDGEGYFVPGKLLNQINVLDGDTVKFKIIEQGEKGAVAKVTRIVKRNGNNIVGRVTLKEGKKHFQPDDGFEKHIYELVDLDKFEVDDVIVSKFVDFKNNIVQLKSDSVVGKQTDARNDWKVVALKNNVEPYFKKEVEEFANKATTKKFPSSALDITNKLIVTIDGEKSKDLDDAVSIDIKDYGWEVGIHIADVSFYVEENDEVDYEAFKRSTSIYLIDQVIPMLPKILSNDLCSLNPNTKKLCMSIFVKLDKNGKTISTEIKQTIIESKYRLTYTEVDNYLQDRSQMLRNDKNLSIAIDEFEKVTNLLRKRKIETGMIDFHLPELQVFLDENGLATHFKNKWQTHSERIIEDLMVLANEEVAKTLTNKDIQSIYRQHGKPQFEKVQEFIEYCKQFGIFISKTPDKVTTQDIVNFLQKIKNNPFETILKRKLIQSMEKAIYTPTDNGHYALGLENYLHFTSPIRRYSDLIVHRGIKKHIFNNIRQTEDEKTRLAEISLQTSEKEKQSMSIERKHVDVKKARYAENLIGQTFEGTISSVHAFGMFIEFSNYIDGLVDKLFLATLNYQFDVNKGLWFNTKDHSKTFKPGMKLSAKIVNIDKVKGLVSLELDENISSK